MLRFWASKLQFWRKSQKSFVFELQSLKFEGSLAEKLHLLIFKASFLKDVSHTSFVFELQSFIFEGSPAEKLRLTKSFESRISWQPNHLNLKSFDIQITFMNLKSIDNQLIWISNRLATKSFESQINLQPNHLNLKSIDNHITWSSNQQTTKIISSTHRLTTKPLESQIIWHPNHLKLKSLDNQNHLNLKSDDNQSHLNLDSFESDINWLSNQLNSAHSLPIGSLSLETSATALCGRYVIYWTWLPNYIHFFHTCILTGRRDKHLNAARGKTFSSFRWTALKWAPISYCYSFVTLLRLSHWSCEVHSDEATRCALRENEAVPPSFVDLHASCSPCCSLYLSFTTLAVAIGILLSWDFLLRLVRLLRDSKVQDPEVQKNCRYVCLFTWVWG